MVSALGGILIAALSLSVAGAIGWIAFSHLRARKLGLPAPTLSSYIPGRNTDESYGAPRPASGGVVGWFNDQVRKVKNRGNRSAAGAYEQTQGGAPRGRQGFGALDPDEAWDARVGHETDGYGYYEEQELSGFGRGRNTEYAGGTAYHGGVAADDYDVEARGRPPTRNPHAHGNPFDDDAESSLRGVSPRPIDTAAAQKHTPKAEPDSAGSSTTERRSVFRENV